MAALSLLSGDAQTFREKVWASHVHLHDTDPQSLVGLLSLDDVDELLTSVALRTPALRIAQDGAVLPTSRFTRSATMSGTSVSGLVDGRKVVDLFEAGATVVLQGLQRYWEPLTRLVRELELELGHPCQANAYLTPPGSQGFARHNDSHDVFVFQTHGRKQWSVWETGTEREVMLEPGRSMYLPTGTPHSARSQEQTSLHVTVGINQLTRRDVLKRVTEQLLAEERYDAALPAGYLEDQGPLAEVLAEELRALARGLSDLDPVAVAVERAESFLTSRTSVLRGGLTDRVALADLDDETLLERRATTPCVLRADGDRLRVLLGDRELRMPLRLTEPMELVSRRRAVTAGDLAPWLDAQSRLVVARRLVREGLLRIVE